MTPPHSKDMFARVHQKLEFKATYSNSDHKLKLSFNKGLEIVHKKLQNIDCPGQLSTLKTQLKTF